MRPPHAVLVTVVAVVALLTVAPASLAAPPPAGICGVCGSAFEQSAERAGVNATVSESDLTVQVTADGDSHWTAHATLSREAADRFAANQTLLEYVVTRTYASSRSVVDEPQNLTVTLNDRIVTTTFTVENVAHRHTGNVLLFDIFAQAPPNGDAYIDADRLTVRGPPGMAVTHAPASGNVTGPRVVWTSADNRMGSPKINRKSYIAFAPDDGIVAQIASDVAIRGALLGTIGTELRNYALIPALFSGLLALGLLFVGRRLPTGLASSRTVIRWLAVGAVLYAALTVTGFVGADDDFGVILTVVGVGLAIPTVLTATVVVLAEHLERGSSGSLTHLASGAIIGWILALVLGVPFSSLLVLGVGPLVYLPFGFLAAEHHPIRVLFPVVVALGAFVAAYPLVPRVGVVFVTPMMFAVALIGGALLGIPLFAIGRKFASESAETSPKLDPTSTESV